MTEASRNPTPKEIRKTVEGFEDFRVDYFQGKTTLQIDVFDSKDPLKGEHALIVIMDYSDSNNQDDIPHEFYFHGGSFELMISILKKLAHFCGPLVVFHESDDPIVVAQD